MARSKLCTALLLAGAAMGALVVVQRARVEPKRQPPAQTFEGPAPAGHGRVHGPRRGRLAWSFSTGGRITGPPAVGPDGIVYVSSHDGHLYAINAAGRLRWRRPLGAAAYGGPTVDARGRIYAGSDAARLWSFDPTGAVRFVVPTGAPVETAPALDASGERLLCAAGRALLALDRDDGTLRWRFEAWGKIFTSPTADARGVYFGAQDRRIYALTPGGERRWAFETGGDVDGSPSVTANGGVYAGSDDGFLYALDARGRLRWRYRTESHVRAPAAFAGDPVSQVLVVSHGRRPALLVLDAERGRLQSRMPLGLSDSSEQVGRAGPVVDAAGVVYVALPDQRVLAIGRSGRRLWAYAASGAIHATPVLAVDGTLYVGSDDGTLYAFRD